MKQPFSRIRPVSCNGSNTVRFFRIQVQNPRLTAGGKFPFQHDTDDLLFPPSVRGGKNACDDEQIRPVCGERPDDGCMLRFFLLHLPGNLFGPHKGQTIRSRDGISSKEAPGEIGTLPADPAVAHVKPGQRRYRFPADRAGGYSEQPFHFLCLSFPACSSLLAASDATQGQTDSRASVSRLSSAACFSSPRLSQKTDRP